MATVVYGDYEWDDAKASHNVASQGVSFEEAATVFADPIVVIVDDGNDAGTFKAIGFSMRARVLVVVHVERGDHDRIVSAWPANAAEKALYRKG